MALALSILLSGYLTVFYITDSHEGKFETDASLSLAKCPPLLQWRGGQSGAYMATSLSGGDGLWLRLFLAAYGYRGSPTEQKIYYLVTWLNV